ncbi:MAG: DUF3726 domain-containing protein [Pseudomonadota bacterium]
MQRSFNEIEMALLKAARGAGHSIGVAEDLARAGIWLCRLGCDGVSLVLDCLAAAVQRDEQLEVNGTSIDLPLAHPMHSALTCIDLAIAEPGSDVRLPSGVLVPGILIGIAGHAAAQHSRIFVVSVGAGDPIYVCNRGASALPLDLPSQTELVVVSDDDDGSVPTFKLSDERPDVPGRLWAKVEALAAQTYVPASEQSRTSGAGAGLTDND